MGKSKKIEPEIICFCNSISKEVIVKAISEGATTLNQIYDQTTAGVGPCGGSCRRKILPLLSESFDACESAEDLPVKAKVP